MTTHRHTARENAPLIERGPHGFARRSINPNARRAASGTGQKSKIAATDNQTPTWPATINQNPYGKSPLIVRWFEGLPVCGFAGLAD
jgi:hypothetical protein